MIESLGRNTSVHANSDEEDNYTFRNIQNSPAEEKRRSRNSMINPLCVNFNENSEANEMDNMRRDREKSGDWRDDEPEITWNSNSYSPLTDEEVNNPPWKCKNLYSISKGNQMKYMTTFYTDTTAEDRILENALAKTDSPEEKNFISNIRESLANYQETLGTPRTEYSFAALIRLMARATGRSLLALLYVIINVVPVIEIFPYILRFILDKTMDIRKTSDFRQTAMKHAILSVQLLSIYICLVFMLGSIVLPLLSMTISIIAKIMLYD